jgi:hypothetical protein
LPRVIAIRPSLAPVVCGLGTAAIMGIVVAVVALTRRRS